MRLFDTAAGEYDAARPSYPEGVYELLESRCGGLAGRTVADGGTGTGIVARHLLGRHAVVVAFDPGIGMIRRARARTPQLRVALADAAAAPLRSGSLDMICFGQSWHWVSQSEGAEEMSRLLAAGGWWAAWWSHPWADGQDWFDRYYGLLEAACPGTSRRQRDVDWCAEAVASHGSFDPPERHIVAWERQATVDEWLTDLVSHSYVIDLEPAARSELMGSVASLLQASFPSGAMTVPYQTRVWMARRRGAGGRPRLRPPPTPTGPAERPRLP